MRKSDVVEEPVYSIGHSTRTIDDFIQILKSFDILRVVDIRTIPKSRHNPQFNKDILPEHLKKSGIEYLHMPKLGGLRHARTDSNNRAWRNPSFRGFADYMQTDDFRSALEHLIELSKHQRVVLMCAESVPWRCHRSLIGDALLARKIQMIDIYSKTASRKHAMTKWAKVRGARVTYPLVE